MRYEWCSRHSRRAFTDAAVFNLQRAHAHCTHTHENRVEWFMGNDWFGIQFWHTHNNRTARWSIAHRCHSVAVNIYNWLRIGYILCTLHSVHAHSTHTRCGIKPCLVANLSGLFWKFLVSFDKWKMLRGSDKYLILYVRPSSVEMKWNKLQIYKMLT